MKTRTIAGLATFVLVLGCAPETSKPASYSLWLAGGLTRDGGALVVPRAGVARGGLWEFSVPAGAPTFLGLSRAADAGVGLDDLVLEPAPGDEARLLEQAVAATTHEVSTGNVNCFVTLGFDCERTVEFRALFAAVVVDEPGVHTVVVARADGTERLETTSFNVERPRIDWSLLESPALTLTSESSNSWSVTLVGERTGRPVFTPLQLAFTVDGKAGGRPSCGMSRCLVDPLIGCPGTYTLELTAGAPDAGVPLETRTVTLTVEASFLTKRQRLARACPSP